MRSSAMEPDLWYFLPCCFIFSGCAFFFESNIALVGFIAFLKDFSMLHLVDTQIYILPANLWRVVSIHFCCSYTDSIEGPYFKSIIRSRGDNFIILSFTIIVSPVWDYFYIRHI